MAEIAVHFRLVLNGYKVFSPSSALDTADLIAVNAMMGTTRIQVKWVFKEKYGKSVRLQHGKKRNKRYEALEFDIIVGYDGETDTCYVYTWDEVKDKKASIAISDEHAEKWDKVEGVWFKELIKTQKAAVEWSDKPVVLPSALIESSQS